MSYKKPLRIVAVLMLILAICFFAFAITHPTADFPWSNTVTYVIYAVYILIMAVLFIASFKNKK